MFQTEPHHFLQTIDNLFFYWLMSGATYLGYNSAYILALIVLFFGVSIKRSYVIMHMLIWTALATSLLKDFFALPRPENVDSSLKKLINEFQASSPFVRQGAQGFFGLPAPEAIEYYRAQRVDSFGFPSGHVSGATAFWGGLALLFEKTWLRVSAALVILLMPFSRMYLGRHFLADVLGGLLLGGLAVFLAWYFLIKKESLTVFEQKDRLRLKASMPTLLFIAGCIGLPLVFTFFGNTVAVQFLGLNVGFFLVGLRGFPSDEAQWFIRALRVVLAIAVLVGSSVVLDQVIKATGLSGNEPIFLLKRGVEMFLMIWGTTTIASRLGWYQAQAAHSLHGQ